MDVTIVPYALGDHEAGAASALGRAFRDDPAILYLLGKVNDPGSRWCMLQGIRGAVAHGQGFVALRDGQVVGGSFWVPPGVFPMMSMAQQLAAGGWAAPYHLGLGGTYRELVREGDLRRRYERDLDAKTWLLDLLGVDPAAQGHGLGKKLLLPMLERADRDKTFVYLVTHKRTNVDFYRRFGFEVVTDETARGVPTGWSMKRPPQ